MAFPFVAAAGMGMQAAGAEQARESTVEGAQAQADIERLNREFQKKLFDEEMARLQPRLDTATQQGLQLMQQYEQAGQIDQSQMPLYGMQLQAGQDLLREQGMDSPYAMGRFATGQAGSLLNVGNVLAQGQQQAGNIRNSMYGNLAGQIGFIPAYMSQTQQQRPTNLQGPQMPLGGIR
jgi:hypothetical protein